MLGTIFKATSILLLTGILSVNAQSKNSDEIKAAILDSKTTMELSYKNFKKNSETQAARDQHNMIIEFYQNNAAKPYESLNEEEKITARKNLKKLLDEAAVISKHFESITPMSRSNALELKKMQLEIAEELTLLIDAGDPDLLEATYNSAGITSISMLSEWIDTFLPAAEGSFNTMRIAYNKIDSEMEKEQFDRELVRTLLQLVADSIPPKYSNWLNTTNHAIKLLGN